jgi:hypothetical protein
MIGLVLTLALLVALAASGWRFWRRARVARMIGALPGGSERTALEVTSFDEVDDHLYTRECPCGGRYSVRGEGTRVSDGRRFRVVRVECMRCERDASVYFDVTRLFQ